MLFSPSSKYAILALSYMASLNSKKPMPVAAIAESAGAPTKFLAKILITLKNHKILKAVKGPGGGYNLNRPADSIRLLDIVQAIETEHHAATLCVLGLDECSDSHPCPLHNEWKRFRDEMDTKIHQLSIADLSDKLLAKRAHLKLPELEELT